VLARESGLTPAQRFEALFHLTPHFAYPLMVMLCLLLLPMLLTVHVNSIQMLLLFDLPLCLAPMISLASFYMLAEAAQGRKRREALKLLPALIALGAGLAPHLTSAVSEGLSQGGGEFVRTPKHGSDRWRYRMRNELPLAEIALGLVCAASLVMSVVRGHYFVTPFVALFTLGFGYVTFLIVSENLARRRRTAAAPATLPAAEPRRSQRGEVVTDLAA
jgi:hypothetical protein